MALYITSLNSGSNGNCFYVGNSQEAVLIDAGLTCKETEWRMEQAGLNMHHVKALFISHEHADHIKGLETIALKYSLPVYCSSITHNQTILARSKANFNYFSDECLVTIGGLTVLPFKKYHDAKDAHSFMVSYNNTNVGIFTDIGRVCSNVIKYYLQCHAVFLEANYDEEMLANGSYPYFLKQRITGGLGHISNKEALEMVLQHKSKQLQHLLLAHLSKNNNCPNLVQQMFKTALPKMDVQVAGRNAATPVLTVRQNNVVVRTKFSQRNKHELQLCLFN